MMDKPKAKNSGQQAELNRALNVTPDDLAANDAGIIPPEQRERILKRQWYDNQGYRGAVIAAGAQWLNVIVIALLVLLINGASDIVANAWFFWLGALFAAMTTAYAGWQWWGLRQSLANSELRTTQGIAVPNAEKERLEINGLSLKLPKDALRRVKNMEPYRVHYLPGSDVVLSMEMLDTDSNLRGAEGRLRDAQTDDTADAIHDDEVTARQQFQ